MGGTVTGRGVVAGDVATEGTATDSVVNGRLTWDMVGESVSAR